MVTPSFVQHFLLISGSSSKYKNNPNTQKTVYSLKEARLQDMFGDICKNLLLNLANIMGKILELLAKQQDPFLTEYL